MKRATLRQLPQQLQLNTQDHFTGELQIYGNSSDDEHIAGEQVWSLYFLFGRLIWASGGSHRFRRWRRSLSLFCPSINPDTIKLRENEIFPMWEYLVIIVLVSRQQIQREQAIAVIEHCVEEVIFDILQNGKTFHQLSDTVSSIKAIERPITILHAGQMFQRVQKRWQNWVKAEMINYSPHLLPYIAEPNQLRQALPQKTCEVLTNLIDNRSTFADIAVTVKKEPIQLVKSLIPYIERGLIQVRTVPDLPPTNLKPVDVSDETVAGKVMCIDDSPTICSRMNNILSQAGYCCVTIQEPIQALPQLLEHKPDLIFLDLVMPVANGYEVCSQIKKVSAFKDIPVIILTGNDGLVDRVRAKLVGASDFISKPVDPDKVLKITQRYLPRTSVNPSQARLQNVSLSSQQLQPTVS